MIARMAASRLVSVLTPLLVIAGLAPAQEVRPAAEILDELRKVNIPSVSRSSDPEARAAFRDAVADAARRQAALALELFEAHPEHSEVPDVLAKRWALITNAMGEPARVLDETAPMLDRAAGDPLRVVALQARGRAALASVGMPASTKLGHLQRAFEADPDDSRCGLQFIDFLEAEAVDPDAMRELCQSTLERWPADRWVAPRARAMLKQLDRIGQPLPFDVDRVAPARDEATRTVVVYWSWPSEKVAAALREVEGWEREIEGLRALGVVNFRIDGGADALVARLAEWGVDLPHHYDEARVGDTLLPTYATPRTPFYYLLDEGGNVLRFAYTAAVMERILRE